MVGGEFGQLASGTQAIMDIYRHAQEQGWPPLLFYVLDEPGGGEAAKRVIEVMRDYTPAREHGVQTVTARPDPRLQGHFYDVWIAGTTGQKEGPTTQAARGFLERLQAQISLGIWEQQPAQHSAEISTWNPVPAIGPEDYERIRQECAEHIIAVQEEHGF
jgi:hypothetical protein